MTELIALLDGREVGIVRQERGRLSFVYAESWRSAAGAYPLSLSMPLVAAEHPHAAIEPFLWGLLPDNDFVLTRWAQRFHVSPRNAFALITNVGEDCAGAVQFVRPERRAELDAAPEPQIEWLSDTDVAIRLRALQADASSWRAPRDTGQFSLAGAQPKTALLFDGQRWGVPSGRTPTTHILKPPTGGFDGYAENEHLCLRLARALGLPAAHSEVWRFEDMPAIVIERYDRVRDGNLIRRVHQEDFCQALRVHPALKYQNEGGPGAKQIVDALRDHVREPSARVVDIGAFMEALIFNWLIGGTDAHAKNYSVLIGAGGAVRLAPLYDIASILAYADIDPQKAKLAMKIGGEYRLQDVGYSEWRKQAAELRMDAEELVTRARNMAAELPDYLSAESNALRKSGLEHPIISTMTKTLTERALRITRTGQAD